MESPSQKVLSPWIRTDGGSLVAVTVISAVRGITAIGDLDGIGAWIGNHDDRIGLAGRPIDLRRIGADTQGNRVADGTHKIFLRIWCKEQIVLTLVILEQIGRKVG